MGVLLPGFKATLIAWRDEIEKLLPELGVEDRAHRLVILFRQVTGAEVVLE